MTIKINEITIKIDETIIKINGITIKIDENTKYANRNNNKNK